MIPMLLALGLVACTAGPRPPREPPPPSVTATGPVDLSGVVSEQHEVQGSIVRVRWDQSVAAIVHVEYRVDADRWLQSPARELGAGAQQELLLGVPYDMPVTWRVVAEVAGGTTVTPDVTTWSGRLPTDLPMPEVVVADPTAWDPDVSYWLVAVSNDASFQGEYTTTLIDREGRVLWSHASPRRRATLQPRVSRTGRSFLIDHSSHWGGPIDEGARSEVLELGIDGEVRKTWITRGLYHAYTDLPDGSLAWPSHGQLDRDRQGGPDGERIIVQAPDGTERIVFDCDATLEVFCASNTLTYDDTRDVFLYSLFWGAQAVLEIDAETGALTKQLGHLPDAWAFDPPDAAFWFQHGPSYTATGTLLVSGHRTDDDHELVAREYALDEATQTLRQIWSFGDGQGIEAAQMGEAHRLPGGNTLHNYGTHAVLREVTPDGRVVWEVRWETEENPGPDGHMIGRSAPVVGDDLYRFLGARASSPGG